MRAARKTVIAELALVVATLIWGSTFVVVKDQLDTLSPATILVTRFSGAAILLGAWLIKQKRSLWRGWRGGVVIGMCLWVTMAAQTEALKITSPAQSAFITALYIGFVPILGFVLLKRRASKQKVVATIVAIIGLWFLTGGVSHFTWGDWLTLLCAVFAALHILVIDIFTKRQNADSLALAFQQFLTVAVLSALWLPVSGGFSKLPTGWALWSVFYLSVFATLGTFGIQVVAQRHTTALRTTLIMALEPVFGSSFSWGLGYEPFSIAKAWGGALILCATLLSEAPWRAFGKVAAKKFKRN